MEFLLVLILGLVFGSFLNVVIYRLKSGQDVFFGRSFCPECKIILKFYDLVPVFSFILLKGRCRYCRKKISWQYPVVEILSGLIWLGVFWKIFGFQPPLIPPLIKGGLGGVFNFIYYIFIFSALLVIAVYDFKWKIIPDKIVYPAITMALIFNLFNSFKFQNLEISKFLNISIFKNLNLEIFIWPLLTASFAFLFFFLIFYFSKGRAMGLGDAKLAFLIGLFLTPMLATIAFMLAFTAGAVFGIILIGLGQIFPRYGKWGMKSQIAFGPFLVLGAVIAFFFSNFFY